VTSVRIPSEGSTKISSCFSMWLLHSKSLARQARLESSESVKGKVTYHIHHLLFDPGSHEQ
jgi:hypothetical protein